MTGPRTKALAIVIALGVVAAACADDAQPDAMSEVFTDGASSTLTPNEADRPLIEDDDLEDQFGAFFPGQDGAIPLVESQMLWGWDHEERYGWVNQDHERDGTTVVDGRRATTTVAGPEVTVWLFGGSTAFGVGQREENTIASRLVDLAEEAGTAIEVVNFGVSGYVNWQEATVFRDALEAGPAPDVAVFYDGANETALMVERATYGLLDPDDTFHLSMTDEQRDELARQADDAGFEPSGDYTEAVAAQAAQYRRGADLARAAGAQYGVDVAMVWQPHLYTIPLDRPLVREALDIWEITPDDQAAIGEATARMATVSGVEPIDLSHALDEVDIPVFFDVSHSNEAGADLQAHALFDEVWPLISERR